MTKLQKDSFIFYRSYFEAIRNLPDADVGRLTKAICEYSLNQKTTKLNGVDNVIFTLIKPQIDANYRKWQNGCKGAEHGDKGGRPKKEKTPKKPLKNPKLTPKEEGIRNNVNDEGIMNKEEIESLFIEYYELYPKKQGKSLGEKKFLSLFNKMDKEEAIELYQLMKNGLESYCLKIKNECTEQCYIKQFSTWMNQSCWEDDFTIKQKPIPY